LDQREGKEEVTYVLTLAAAFVGAILTDIEDEKLRIVKFRLAGN
jgi:hypothetical protein